VLETSTQLNGDHEENKRKKKKKKSEVSESDFSF